MTAAKKSQKNSILFIDRRAEEVPPHPPDASLPIDLWVRSFKTHRVVGTKRGRRKRQRQLESIFFWLASTTRRVDPPPPQTVRKLLGSLPRLPFNSFSVEIRWWWWWLAVVTLEKERSRREIFGKNIFYRLVLAGTLFVNGVLLLYPLRYGGYCLRYGAVSR